MAKKISRVLASQRDYILRPFALANHTHPPDYPPVVADIAARDNLPADQRYEGVIIYVQSDQTTYQLRGGTENANWITLVTATGVASHTELGDIGTNTHAQIDTHIADATLHFTMASISITESQISDLQSYALASHNHDATYLGINAAAASTNALATATGNVSISASAAPLAGQVLMAIDGTSAEWTTLFIGGGDGDLVQSGTPVDTNVAYFTADKNISGSNSFTFLPGTKEVAIRDLVNTGTQALGSYTIRDNINQIIGQIGFTATGANLALSAPLGDISLTPEATHAIALNSDVQITGNITAYGGATPADGAILTWNSTNAQAEFSAISAMLYNAAGGFSNNVEFAFRGYQSSTEIVTDAQAYYAKNQFFVIDNFQYNSNITRMYVGVDAASSTPGITVRGTATSNPFIQLEQVATPVVTIAYDDTAAELNISVSDDSLFLRPANLDTFEFTQNTNSPKITFWSAGTTDVAQIQWDNANTELVLNTTGLIVLQTEAVDRLTINDTIITQYVGTHTKRSAQLADYWFETDAGVDQGWWNRLVSNEGWQMRVYSDDFLNTYVWEDIQRSGTGAGVQVDTIQWDAETSIAFGVGGNDISWNASVLAVGNGTGTNCTIDINGNATSSPGLAFKQAGATKAFLEWLHSDTALAVNSDDAISLKPFNAEAFRITNTVATFSVRALFQAGTTSNSSFNIPAGVAPTTPVDGDVWATTTDAFIRLNGTSLSLILPAANSITTAMIQAGAVENGNISNRLALSVMGRPVNVIGSPSDIVAGTDGHVLTRVGTTLAFAAPIGTIGGSIADDQIAVGAATADAIEGSADLRFFSGTGGVRIQGTQPGLIIYENGGAVDQKVYSEDVNGGVYVRRIQSDDFVTGSYTYQSITRSGTGASVQVDTIDFTSATDITLNTLRVILGNYTFQADQTVGVGQDNYVLTYNNTNGLISLEPASVSGVSVSGTPAVNQLGIWTDASTQKGDAALTFNSSIDELIVGDTALSAPTVSVSAPALGNGRFAFRSAGVIDASIVWDDTNSEMEIDIGGVDMLRITSTAVTFAGDISVPAGERIYLDGGGDTWIDSPVSNEIHMTCGTVEVGRFTTGGLELISTARLYLDGGTDTYIYENAADSMRFMVGAQIGLTLVEANNLVSAEFTGQVWSGTFTLTDGATVNWDLNNGNNAQLTLGGNRTMAAPTNMKNGGTYTLKIIQDATGSRTITWNAVFKWPSGSPPALSTGASAVDYATFISDGTNMYGVVNTGFA